MLNDAGEMHLRRAAVGSFVTLCLASNFAFGSHFHLIKASGNEGEFTAIQLNGGLDKVFFACDREQDCIQVLKFRGASSYIKLYRGNNVESWNDVEMAWEKIHVNYIKENIAFGKPTFLSSKWSNETDSQVAVDGTIGDCAETNLETKGWITVDLKAVALVTSVKISGPNPERRAMDSFDVRVGYSFESGGITNPTCKQRATIPAKRETIEVSCPEGLIGRYVTINNSDRGYLEICEIEVYGSYV